METDWTSRKAIDTEVRSPRTPRNSHYVEDLFWQREPRTLTPQQMRNYYGWRTLLLLQFQHQFQLLVLVGTSGCALVIMRDLTFAICNTGARDMFFEPNSEAVLYMFDAFYTLDILLMCVYKSITWPEVSYLHHSRPGYVLFMEVLTIPPYELMSNPQESLFHIVRARYILRLVRIVYILRHASKITSSEAWLRIYAYFIGWIIFFSFSFCIVICFIYTTIDHLSLSQRMFYSVYMLTASRVTNKGFGEVDALKSNMAYYEYNVMIFIHILSFLVIASQICKCACWLVPKMKYSFAFARRMVEAKKSLDDWKKLDVVTVKNYHNMFEKTVLSYFKMTWSHNKSPRFNLVPGKQIPAIMAKDIALDATWDAFHHSHIFNRVDSSFLRSISVYMKRNVFYPGEIIVKKNRMKSCMIYVITGIIQVLSEENSETPIMSLTSGSCIGESTLFLDYLATCTVVANSYTEVYVLKRYQFIKVCSLYPNAYRTAFKRVMGRYNKARMYHKAFQIQKNIYRAGDDADFLPTLYILTTVRRFTEPDRILTREDYRLVQTLKDYVFCADYLDMIVLPDDLQLVADSVFISKKLPFIFQPNSVFLQLWDFVIGSIACILICLYPIALCNVAGQKFTNQIKSCLLAASVLWTIDVYIRISTAVRTRHVFYTNISDIIYYRLSTASFLIDIACIIPIGPILFLINSNMQKHVLMLLEIHKLMKVYRINTFIKKITELNNSRVMIFNVVKVFIVLFFLFYYSCCVLYLLICSETCTLDFLHRLEQYYQIAKGDVLSRFTHVFTVASYFISDTTLFPFLEVIPYYDDIIIFGLQIIYCGIYIWVQSLVIATEVVNNQEKHEYREFVSNMGVMLTKVRFPPETNKKIFEFLKKQYFLDGGVSFLYENSTTMAMTKSLKILYKYIMYGKHINDIKIFANVEENLIREAARRCNVSIYLAGEVVTYAGEVCRSMFYIMHGYCKVIYRDGTEKIITAKQCISAYELCMKIPNINTVITHTDCQLLALSSTDLANVLKCSPSLKDDIEAACQEDQKSRQRVQNLLDEEVVKPPSTPNMLIRKSFMVFKWTKKKSENLDYHTGFPQLWIICKFVLMRVTIIPDGAFLVIWELFRCILAFGTNVLSSVAALYTDDPYMYAIIFLDATAWLDLYVMHHVCYYDERGLFVYHPLKTAKYYWSHRFALDLFACLPIDYLFRYHRLYMYFRLNRLFQLYRVIAYLKYFDMHQLYRKHFLDFVKYFPLTLLAIYYISNLILIYTCFPNGFSATALKKCAAGYLVDKRMINASYTPINAITANLLLTVTSFAMINTTKIRFQQSVEMFVFSVVVIVGTGFSLWLTSKMVASNFFRNSDLTTFQQNMRDLLNFYSFRKVDKNIKKEMINHFEFMWLTKSGKNINEITNRFKPCFKEDMLYKKFGNHLTSSSVFLNAPTSFYKSIIVEMAHRVVLKKAIIYRVNDIIENIFFIVGGKVEVLGADYRKLIVLEEGSLFGNLSKKKYTRQSLTMVAKSNMELLIINSKAFHDILQNYSSLNNSFKRVTAGSMDYLENEFTIRASQKKISTVDLTQKKKFYDFYFKCSPLFKKYKAMKNADNILIIITGFIAFHYEGYQKAVMATDWISFCVLYFFDILFLIRIYLKLHTTFINTYGIVVYNKRLIIRNYAEQHPGLYFDIIAGAPLEVISYFFVWSKYFPVIFNCLRLNRMMRIYLFVNILRKTQEKLHINVALIRVWYTLTLTTIYIQVMAILLFYTRFASDPSVRNSEYGDTRPVLYKNSIFIVAYSTVGAPVNNFRIRFTFAVSVHCVLITTLGRFIITLFIAETCATLEAINKSRNLYKEFAVGLTEYMKTRDISLSLHKETLQYVNLLWSNYRGVLNPALMKLTPYYLKEATFNAMFGYHLRKHNVLSKFHVDLIRQMTSFMEVLIFYPENHVVYRGDVDQTMYFVHEGDVDALLEDSLEVETVALSLEAGDSFGLEQGLFPNTPHMYTYKIRKPTVLIALRRETWYHLLSFFPASQEILDIYYKDPTDKYDENIKNYVN